MSLATPDSGTVVWLWQGLRWTDVLDIGLMALLVYRLLLIMRGTRALQSLLGLGALGFVYLASDRLQLNGIRWLLNEFFVYIVVAVLILFQQDIRRALAGAGGRLFPVLRSEADASMLEEIVRASFSLAARRMGALITIEREATLDEYLDASVRMDALVSDDLLLAIFHPTSPIHDGAVVIKKGRIAAAQAFFPLSLSKDVSRFFGTRHRAALGITEETDAVVIIVSEERGTVSIVDHGEIQPTSDQNELRARLQAIFGDSTPRAREAGAHP